MGGRRKKLLTVARLYFGDPTKYGRSCLDCRTWVYDEDNGKVKMSRITNFKEPMPRPKRSDPPCHECGKTVGKSERHWRYATDPPLWCYRTFRHWLTCRAVGTVPDNPIVHRNAYYFSEVAHWSEMGKGNQVLEVLGLIGQGRKLTAVPGSK